MFDWLYFSIALPLVRVFVSRNRLIWAVMLLKTWYFAISLRWDLLTTHLFLRVLFIWILKSFLHFDCTLHLCIFFCLRWLIFAAILISFILMLLLMRFLSLKLFLFFLDLLLFLQLSFFFILLLDTLIVKSLMLKHLVHLSWLSISLWLRAHHWTNGTTFFVFLFFWILFFDLHFIFFRLCLLGSFLF